MTETISKIVSVILSEAKNLKTGRRRRRPLRYYIYYFVSFVERFFGHGVPSEWQMIKQIKNMSFWAQRRILKRVVEGADPYNVSFIVNYASLLEGGIFAKNDGRRQKPSLPKGGWQPQADGRIRLLPHGEAPPQAVMRWCICILIKIFTIPQSFATQNPAPFAQGSLIFATV